ncbi:extracellular matrix protein 1-like [Scomber japonicus]|uniref:extracellular matrix protein 1-like n=1 Tax=Scomber japonicus TaxID=13676 RepID=UPI002305750B|nr:extracellular matrix protein 1-like [Scomber japonicus]
MGSSGALVCAIAVLLTVLSSASTDDRCLYEQCEVTFDIDQIMQEMQPPDLFTLQKEADLSDLFDPKEFPIEQVLVSPRHDGLNDRGGFTPRGRRPSFGPRSHPPAMDYPVKFPHGRPTSDNLQAICLHGDHRPRYPDSYFPSSGFGQQVRRASAINKAESWFSECCKGNQTWGREVTLCCATQAWKQSVNNFCEEDSSVKDRLYHCCKRQGNERLNCFHNDAPNPSYEATEELPVLPLPSSASFNFDPNTCQRTVMTPYSVRRNRGKKEKKPVTSQKVDIRFPPGRPTAAVIESLCRNQKIRPLYSNKCLPNIGYEWLARQAKTINRMEKGFKQCCKKRQDVLVCAEQKWREELNKFCLHKNSDETSSRCCLDNGENDRYDCFQNISPDPHYNMTSATEELSLNKMCDTHKIIKKKFPVGFPLKNFVDKCCPLSPQDQTDCFGQRLKETSQNLCLSQRIHTTFDHCCRQPVQESPQCISKILMDAITKATNLLRQKKKKRCPIS